MLLTHDKGAAAPGHTWEPGEVVEVEDKLASELLAIKDAGFRYVEEVESGVKKVKGKAEPQATFAEVDPKVPASEVDPASVTTSAAATKATPPTK